MSFRLAVITDLHFGTRTRFRGKLRKVADAAPALTNAFVQRMNGSVHPDLVLALGDFIEDESHDADLARYRECVRVLRQLTCPLRFAAGNHDTIHLRDDDLRAIWQHDGALHYSFDTNGYHVCVLRTVERPLRDVTLPADQLAWLEQDLASTTLPTVVAMHHSAADQDLRGNPWFEHAPHLALIDRRDILRAAIAASGKVVLVVNGHVHWNHVDLHDGIPYVTVQSLTENVDDDEPGRAAAAWGVFRIDDRALSVVIEGEQPLRFTQHTKHGNWR
jgi:Icc protein